MEFDLMKDQCQKLRELLKSEKLLLMPDAYDPLSAKMIESAGFKASQCSGYSFSIAAGMPYNLQNF